MARTHRTQPKAKKPFGPNPHADRDCIEHWVAQTLARAAELRFINMPRAAAVLTDWARELERRAGQLPGERVTGPR